MFLDSSPAAICAEIETASGQGGLATKTGFAAGSHTDDAAPAAPYPRSIAPHHQPIPYVATDAILSTTDQIVSVHRLRQGMIRAQTKLALQGQAVLRLTMQSDDDFASDEAKAKARKRTESLYRTVVADVDHPLYGSISPYLMAMQPLDAQRAAYEKALVKLAKQLPVYEWVKSVKGFGDISFATIVGECGDIGSYKSVSAVWKRMGLAVINGCRQGNPGAGATAEDWIAHGYNKPRRSVSWNARNNIIGGMGKWRPIYGASLDEAEYFQRVFAERARYEMDRFGLPVKCADTGKESYNAHTINRAMRYAEKRLLKYLYLNWRRAAA